MAQTIKIKNGSEESSPASLVQGEFAVNVSSGSLWYGSGSSNVTKSSFHFSELTCSKVLDSNGAEVGSGNVKVTGTLSASYATIGGTAIVFNTNRIIKSTDAGTGYYTFQDGGVEVNGSIRTSGNITATGSITASGTISGSSNLELQGDIVTDGFVNVVSGGQGYKLGSVKALWVNGAEDQVGRETTITKITGSSIKLGGTGDVHITASGTISGSSNLELHGTIYAANIGTGVDNSVVVLDSDGKLKTDEIDGAVWGGAGAVLTVDTVNEQLAGVNLGEMTVGGAATATTATTATNVTAVATTDATDFFVGVMDGASGAQAVESSVGLKYNPSTKGLTVDGTGSFTNVTASAVISAPAYVGTKHLLYSGVIYINANPFTQNAVYMGNNYSNQDSNWNTAQAAGGTLGSTSTISIAEDNFRWGMILPFDVSAVELQVSCRPGGTGCTGDNFFVGLYGAARPNNNVNANLDITLLAHNDEAFVQGRFVSNDFTHTANLSKGYMIFIGIGSEDATAAKNAPALINCIITQR